MDLTTLIDQVKKLTTSLIERIDKCKEIEFVLADKILAQDDRQQKLDAIVQVIGIRESKVAKIESAQMLLLKAEQRNNDAEEKQVELFDREKLLAESEVKLDDNLKKLVRDRDDFHKKNKDLTRDWIIFNQKKKDYEKKVKSFV